MTQAKVDKSQQITVKDVIEAAKSIGLTPAELLTKMREFAKRAR